MSRNSDSGSGMMNPVEALPEAANRYPEVRAAYIFGSAAVDRAGPLSDIDVAVLFGRNGGYGDAGGFTS